MGVLVNHKLVERVEDNHSIYDANFRVCDFDVTDTGVFLILKCYSGKEQSKHRLVRICLTDFIHQIWRGLSSKQRHLLRMQLQEIIKY